MYLRKTYGSNTELMHENSRIGICTKYDFVGPRPQDVVFKNISPEAVNKTADMATLNLAWHLKTCESQVVNADSAYSREFMKVQDTNVDGLIEHVLEQQEKVNRNMYLGGFWSIRNRCWRQVFKNKVCK